MLLGGIQQAFYGGQSPWQYEVLFVSRAKSVAKATGVALSRELAELVYDVDYYVHIDIRARRGEARHAHAVLRATCSPPTQLNAYAGPVVEQSVNQIVQLTPLERVNEKIHEITELVRGHLQDFLAVYGIMLNDVKVLIRPQDERMRELISLRAFGLSELDAVRYYVAMKMAERGLVSAPNMAVGAPVQHRLRTRVSLTYRGPERCRAGPDAVPHRSAPPLGVPLMAGQAFIRPSWPVTDSIADQLRGLLGSDVYTSAGRLRADDLLVRERCGQSLADAGARLRQLSSAWRAERVPPSTREDPFPPAAVMEPLRRADRIGRAIDGRGTADPRPAAAEPGQGLGPGARPRPRGAAPVRLDAGRRGRRPRRDAGVAPSTWRPWTRPSFGEHLAKLRSVIADRRRYLQIA